MMLSLSRRHFLALGSSSAVLAGCRRTGPAQPVQPGADVAPVTLTYLTDRTGEGEQIERELFDRFTAETPKTTIEIAPNAQNQPSRTRVVVLHAAGTPADFFTSS